MKVTPYAETGATLRVGKVTWPGGVETVAWATVGNGSQSGAIALNYHHTIIRVEVTHSGSVGTHTLSIQKPLPPPPPPCSSSSTLTHEHQITQSSGISPILEHRHEKRMRHGVCRVQVIVGNKVIDSLYHTH